MVERIDAWMAALGPWGYLLLAAAALIEYVFPPFPGDTILLLGGVYVVRGQRPWPLVLMAVTLGSVLGAAINYVLGRRLAEAMERSAVGTLQSPRMRALHRVQEQMKVRGNLLLVVNRFLPGIRAVIFWAAGAARLPWRQVLGLGALSALGFNAIAIGVGFLLGGNLEHMGELLARYQLAVYALIGVAGLALGVRWLVRRTSTGPPY